MTFLKSRNGRHTRLGLAAVFAALCGAAQAQPTAAGQALVMSDLHFDPMADPRLVDQLVAADPEQWKAVLESSGETSLGRYGRDTNWVLLRSALQQMVATLAKPAVVLVSGDFLAHNFRDEFDAAASDHSDPAYRVFVRKTMQFMARQLAESFPETPILPALGNNDEECGDYQLQPGGPFLADTLPILHSLVGGGGTDFDEDWKNYGNYSFKAGSVRVLSTNTNFFSTHYRNPCGSQGDAEPGRATLAWLKAGLATAKQAGEPVWLLYHIPPGIDGYATWRRGVCPGGMIPMWDQAYSEPFYALLRQYADTITASFAGHTHMDDFRLIGDAGTRFSFALITPAISPIFGQNPAFRTMVYDYSGGILDQTTYDLTNLPEANTTGGAPPGWRAEYSFTKLWNLPRVDLASLERLYLLTTNEPEPRERWHTIFPVSSTVYWPQVADGDNGVRAGRAFHCATGNVLLSDYRQCYCAGQ